MNLAAYAAEFDRCAQWIEPALEYAHGCYTIDDVRNYVLSGDMQLWPGERSAIVTQISQFPQRTVCTVAFAGGDIDELKAAAPGIEAWAKRSGCDLIYTIGRHGWARALATGRISHTVSVKEL